MAVRGTLGEGFNTKVLPQAIASGYIHIGTMAGKLNGVIPAQTPTGSIDTWPSMPRATLPRACPMMSDGMLQDSSTNAAPYITPRFFERFSVLACHKPGQTLKLFLKQSFVAKQDARTFHHWSLCPAGQSFPG